MKFCTPKKVTILFDGDKAGVNASLRGMDLILENDMNVNIVSFPKNEDPDSLSKRLGKEKFLKYLSNNEINLIRYKVDILNSDFKNDPIKKSEMIFDIVKSISKIPNSIKRSVFIKETSSSLNINEESLITELNKLLINNKVSKPLIDIGKSTDENTDEINKIHGAINFHEKECIRMLVNYGTKDFEVVGLNRKSFIKYFLNEIEDVEFNNKNYLKIIKIFKEEFENNNVIDINYFLNENFRDIKDDIIDLSTSKYEISDKWKNKYNIHVTEETDTLKQTTYTNILRLKFRLIKKMIKDNLKNLNNINDSNLEKEILAIHNKLKSAEIEIADKLGNVTSI